MSNLRWECKEGNKELAKTIAEDLNISLIIAQLLTMRGINSSSQAKDFLEPNLKEISSAWQEVPSLKKAKERIEEGIKRKEKILIYGDYDLDGICGIAVLFSALKEKGADVSYFVPHRLREGYGLNKGAILKAKKRGFSLILTVDCGVKDVEEVEYAHSLGMEVIVTDHHLPSSSLPPAKVLVNPKLKSCQFPFSELAGVGVAFALAQVLLDDFREEDLDLVALGTVADLVPLWGENRTLVKEGLSWIKKSRKKGLQALLKVSGLEDTPQINADYHVAYILAPRLNSAGRLWNAAYGVELLLTADEVKAKRIAQILDSKNRERQDLQEKIFKEALKLVEEEIDLSRERVIVLSHPNWHVGVIGIVASKVLEVYHRPTILISTGERPFTPSLPLVDGVRPAGSYSCIPVETTRRVVSTGGLTPIGALAGSDPTAKGSARSIEGFPMFESLSKCEDLLLSFGGHKLAAGLTIKEEKIAEFRSRINLIAQEVLKEEDLQPRLPLDLEIELGGINLKLLKELDKLAPYGMDNPLPLFYSRGLKPEGVRLVGNEDKHLKLIVRKGEEEREVIGFGMGGRLDEVLGSARLDLAFSLGLNSWGGEEIVQLNLKDIKGIER